MQTCLTDYLAQDIFSLGDVIEDVITISQIVKQKRPIETIVVNNGARSPLREDETGVYLPMEDTAYVRSSNRFSVLNRIGHEYGHKNSARRIIEGVIRNEPKAAFEYEISALIDQALWFDIIVGNEKSELFINYLEDKNIYVPNMGQKSFYEYARKLVVPNTTEAKALDELRRNGSI